ncbi:MAG TPA: amidohydrolase family protein [Streptosporangiaceae bacterium]|jgi:imidazolonepropionase-like amidohydrolase
MSVLRVRGPVLAGPDDVRDGLWVVGGRVTYTAPSGAAGDTTVLDGWALPGLVDAHCHVGLGAHGPVDAATAERQAVTDRDAGTLLIRDAGSPVDTRWVDDRTDLPRVIRAGRHIARPRRYIRDVAEEVEPADLTAQVVTEARRGDGWVKLVGDWIDRTEGDLTPCWPRAALDQAIAAAHAEGARVTAHCFGEECLPDLIAAGIDCIEHATGLTDATIASCAANNVAIVPTLINIATFPDIAEAAEAKFPVYAKHMRALHTRRHQTVRSAYEAGIPIYAGTDAGGTLPHGLIANEVAELTKAGLPVLEALSSATWKARPWLNHPSLEEGAQADLALYPSDPRQALRVLSSPTALILRGHAHHP